MTHGNTSQNQRGTREYRDRGGEAKRSFGQCFLTDSNIARSIANHAVIAPRSTMLEVGAGRGALTTHLLAAGANVIAIERDRDLIPVLTTAFEQAIGLRRLQIVEADAVTADWGELLRKAPAPHVLVGNIPYQITGRLLQKASHMSDHFDRVVFMVQREVADRMQAAVGSQNYGAMSVFVQHRFRVVHRITVAPSCFRPQPSVYSAVVVLQPRPIDPQTASASFANLFQSVVTIAFSHRRKTLRNAYKGAFNLSPECWQHVASRAGVSLDRRPQTLCPNDFACISFELSNQLDIQRIPVLQKT